MSFFKEKKVHKDKEEKKEQPKEPKEPDTEISELKDKYLRLQADFDNFRKRSAKERSEFVKFANESLILELLFILDNFERGIKSAEQKKDFDLLHKGVDMISKQLHELLKAKGLLRIETTDKVFDPAVHEAIEQVEAEDKKRDNVVVEELQAGYTLNGVVI
ncbi:MAG TPA: nucleotide exchange factor GrpE, partial [Candidatus Omnitrophica bacterium]|nr:nucleotide exchange factor GrpE [Candidatus Omnitrophota bacterium]